MAALPELRRGQRRQNALKAAHGRAGHADDDDRVLRLSRHGQRSPVLSLQCMHLACEPVNCRSRAAALRAVQHLLGRSLAPDRQARTAGGC
jgi:hypothetical protein